MSLTFLALVSSMASASLNSSWTKLSEGPFSKREGLMAVSTGDAIFLAAGRGTNGVGFARDVWMSKDGGSNWTRTTDNSFPRRAYHNLLYMNGCMYLFGGQTFSTFYNDVWQSCDGNGVHWKQLTAAAPWPVRSGAAAVVTSSGEMIVAGGCYQAGKRSFRGDVWASRDGANWTLRTSQAEWSARSGPRLVEFKGALFLVAGERGFTASTQLADVWKSMDGGRTWTEVVKVPAYSARSGHGVVVSPDGSQMLVVAGWPKLHDLWTTEDGAVWTKASDRVWNCESPSCGKFDFWSVVHRGNLVTMGGALSDSTFGTLYQDVWTLPLH